VISLPGEEEGEKKVCAQLCGSFPEPQIVLLPPLGKGGGGGGRSMRSKLHANVFIQSLWPKKLDQVPVGRELLLKTS